MSPSPIYHTEIIGNRPIITSRHTDTSTLRTIGPWRLKVRQRANSEGGQALVLHDESNDSELSFTEVLRKMDEECAIIKQLKEDDERSAAEKVRSLQTISRSQSPLGGNYTRQLSKAHNTTLLLALLIVLLLMMVTFPPVICFLASYDQAPSTVFSKTAVLLSSVTIFAGCFGLAMALFLALRLRTSSSLSSQDFNNLAGLLMSESFSGGIFLTIWILFWVT